MNIAIVGLGKYGTLLTEQLAKENHDIELITASFDTDSGYLWFVYDREILDANNQTISGSRDVLVRVALAKTDQVGEIVEVKERP